MLSLSLSLVSTKKKKNKDEIIVDGIDENESKFADYIVKLVT